MARKNLVDEKGNEVRSRVLDLVMGIRLTTRLLAIGADVQSALKDADARVQKSLKANDGEISPRTGTASRSSAASSPSASPTVSGRCGSPGWGWRRPWACKPDQLQLKDDPLPDTSQVRPPDLEAALTDAIQQRPDLKALDAGILAKEAEVRAARAELLPQVGLVGQFAWGTAPGRDIISNPYVGDYFNALTIGGCPGHPAEPVVLDRHHLGQQEGLGAEHAPQATGRCRPGHPGRGGERASPS